MTPADDATAAEADMVDVVVESALWRNAGLDPEQLARAGVAAARAEIGAAPAPVAIVFAADDLLRRLNARFRGKDAPTNVLAFPSAPEPATREEAESGVRGADMRGGQPLGDVVLAFETIAAEADAHGIPLPARTLHMIVHGFLHLQGYDHQTHNDAEKMESMERKALARLGLPDPYEVDAHA